MEGRGKGRSRDIQRRISETLGGVQLAEYQWNIMSKVGEFAHLRVCIVQCISILCSTAMSRPEKSSATILCERTRLSDGLRARMCGLRNSLSVPVAYLQEGSHNGIRRSTPMLL